MQSQVGLFYTVNQSVQLLLPQNVHVKVKIIDIVAHVRLSQTYTNKDRTLIKTSYRFPLPYSSAVDAFEVEFSDGRI
ncbi:hypothetical protein BC936DRAFT_140398, partial [Jimgerdemannia flammicorona]